MDANTRKVAPVDTVFHFTGWGQMVELRGRRVVSASPFARPGCCRLRLFDVAEKVVAIATELDDNDGPSVTNAAEHIAAEVCSRYSIAPPQLVWFEHYDQRGEPVHRRGTKREKTGESFDRVTFQHNGARFTSPRWKPSTRAEVEALIERELD